MNAYDYDVTALGELLVDFTESGSSAQGNLLLEANPGGAPCNVLAMLARLGRRTAFLGKVGNDAFGALLRGRAAAAGIDVSALRTDDAVPTTLAFVHTQPDGERDFTFYRAPGADVMLRADELDREMLQRSRIFHFGTLSMTAEPARGATQAAIACAKGSGCLLSFDPNLRLPLWASATQARSAMEYGLAQCDILKISDDELAFLTGETDADKAVAQLRGRYPLPLVFATMGRGGSRAYFRDAVAYAPAFLTPRTVDATGAGDTFFGCALHFVLQYGMDGLNGARLAELLRFSNAAASLVTTRRGALSVMPTPEEIAALLRTRA